MRNRPIYHITHVANLPSILESGRLWSDAQCRQRQCTAQNVGYNHIKARRMRRPVPAYPGTTLGEYVPFNFCPRSVMLYVLSHGHQDYRGGQGDILHLVSTVGRAVDSGRRWAFTDRHADLGYTQYFTDLNDENEVSWSVMDQHYWANEQETKERRQAEFLVYDWFPLVAITEIGVMNRPIQQRVQRLLADLADPPAVNVKSGWYY